MLLIAIVKHAVVSSPLFHVTDRIIGVKLPNAKERLNTTYIAEYVMHIICFMVTKNVIQI